MMPPLRRPALGRPIRLFESIDVADILDVVVGILELGRIVTFERKSSGVAGRALPSFGEEEPVPRYAGMVRGLSRWAAGRGGTGTAGVFPIDERLN